MRTCPGPLDPFLYNRHLHIPQDPYHAVAGKVARFLDCTCSILTSKGESYIIQYWKTFETPRKWSRLPNPIKHQHSFMMSDVLRLLMILPLYLNLPTENRLPIGSIRLLPKLIGALFLILSECCLRRSGIH